ncbi:alkanesulfonate monooxygenase SsuD/methylene tetrahydromethanopterin reductase-like flavin-dependent oxidoreductase (luciferase family) [Curtobacterium sp. PhB142]|uniref:LLM class flavin-dependent oxidoreductase n=1 Tax=unclassified Curtobacterium TaxID=257496 RepID=UPI00104BD4A6|nr:MULTISPECIES: LLM class flavin-dependent oxidoreductase [unclassified Curtobacterium]TCL85038.1 alkanesulfonate monooxygenase SsuD/methylene tetrahydromethanopterin reductase-like flavin-dependent oxidoreductase (luciferase family) [Curtobacterium sp. PhB142]TCM02031.1 alkanesulfonate monooxygenase SsuD/methylene tetrahydromethanopterin reductase-like flavin-dependent oxidoreductase (luciferase family) [Curtobacterium sp. PhB134]
MPDRITLVTALQGAGWHPAAWRVAGPAAQRLSSLRHWRDVVVEQDRLGIDAVTIEDSFTAGPTAADHDLDLDTTTVVGRLDALLVANAVAPATRAVGLVPTVSVTHTEPFHVATGLQTLDHVSLGRAGWRIQVSPTTREAALFGRRPGGDDAATLFDEAREAAEVVSRLWDSWDDDAIIRDVTTGRFIDRDRIHNAEYAGRHLSVHGASIVPRSPQGRPPVFALAHRADAAAFAVDAADVVLVTPGYQGREARDLLDEVRHLEQVAGSDVRRPVLADLAVLIGSSTAAAADELAALDAAAGAPYAVGSGSDTSVLATTVPELVSLIGDLRGIGFAGVRLRPLRIPIDSTAIARQLVPALVTAGLRADVASRPTADLRTRLGIAPAVSRYASAPAGSVSVEVSA